MKPVFELDSIESCKLLYGNPIRTESEGILLRSRLQAAARRLGFSESQRENMVLVASEMASNQVKYAGQSGVVQIWQQDGPAIDIVALDFGPGIQNLPQAQEDGFSSHNTLGKGLGSIRRLSDESGVFSVPAGNRVTGEKWHGTLIWARFRLDHQGASSNSHGRTGKNDRKAVEYGLFSRALADDRFNGDRVYLQRKDERIRWLHLDGLGHGEGAQQATSNLGGYIFGNDDPLRVLATIDRQMTGSRGAVAIFSEVDLSDASARIMGIGDMGAHIVMNDEAQNVNFAPGILGREHKTPAIHRVGCDSRCVIVTASDGIRRNWKGDSFPGLFRQHPQTIAYLLGNVMGRVADDQSICVLAIA